MTTPRRATGGLAVLLAAVLAVSACSDAPDGDGASTAPAATDEQDAGEATEPPAEAAPSPEPGPDAPLEPPAAADDPEGLTRQLVDAETALRTDDLSERGAAAAGMLQQVAYRRLASTPEWRDAVLAAVPAELRPAVAAQTDAAAGMFRLARPQPQLPSWRIVEPPPAEELLGHYRAAEAEFGVGWEYLASIHLVETRMGRIRGTSVAGAQGPMQFMPGTWAQYGEGDIDDPRDAIRAAARYLRASGAPGEMDRALFAYNRSEAYVQAIRTYADLMRADPRLYRGYYSWQVFYRHVDGDRLLPVGYDGTTG